MGRKRRRKRGRGTVAPAAPASVRQSNRKPRRRFRLGIAAAGAALLAATLLVAYLHSPDPTTTAVAEPEIPRPASLAGLDPWVTDALTAALAEAERRPSASTYGRLGRLYLAHELYDVGRRCFEIAERLAPNAAEWPYYLGVHFQERGDTEEAVARFRRTLSLRPDYAAARFRLGETLLAAGRLEEARAEFLALSEAAAAVPAAQLGLAKVARRQGDLEEARRLLEDAAAGGNREAAYLLAMTLRELGQAEEAARILESWRPDPSLAVPLPDPFVAQVLAERLDPRNFTRTATDHLKAGRLDVAERLLERVLEIDPREYDALFNLGLLRGRQQRFEESEQLLRRAVAVAPENPDSHFGLATAFAAQGRLEEALSEIGEALALDPDHTGALELRQTMIGR